MNIPACTRRKFLTSTLAAAFVLGLAASHADAQSKKPRIVFLTPVTNDFFIPVAAGMKAAAAQFGWESQFVGPPTYDVARQVEMFYTAIHSKADAIAVALADPEAFSQPIKEAKAAGILVIGYNTDVPASGRVAYVGQDHETAGRNAGLRVMQLLKDKAVARGTILLVAQNFGNVAQDARMTGFKKAFEGSAFKIEPLAAGVNDVQYVGSLEARVRAIKDVVAIFGVDVMSKNIANYIESNRLAGKMVSGGWNLTDVHLDAVKNGRLDFTVGQSGYLQGYFPVVLANLWKFASYQPIDVDTGTEIVDRSNVATVMAREAKWQELGRAK
jgi:simple sugar transport system substrate-binding protein